MVKLDLVERESVKDAIGFMNLHFLGHGENKSVLDSINEVPSVDAVPVVRCKDCRWFNTSRIKGRRICDHPTTGILVPEETDYCPYGERKDNE